MMLSKKVRALAFDSALSFAEDQMREGHDLLLRVMELQDTESDDEDGKRGNFPVAVGDMGVTDLNSLSFCGPYLGYIALEHEASLEKTLKKKFFEITLPC